jgi:glycosyltransferase involved in cell wall biosynthesis
MKKYDLSIVIPSRNEEFAARTVEDIVKNKRGNTEVIVVLDGALAEPQIADHPDVRVIYLSESIGQRAATNLGVKLSEAKYVAKCDAHTAYDEGFDLKLMDGMQDDWTVVPVMRNLHAFSWVCDDCGHETYQGPVPEGCANSSCAGQKYSFHKEVKWIGKQSPQSTAYLFNRKLQFWYFNELKKRQNREGGKWVETMSLQGSFFMLTREKYWELNICDETWGSWGQQGTEVALKTWLSGGRVVCKTDTWYAHMFRTRDGFSFPYPMSGKDQDRARKISRDLFLNNKWDKQVRPLSWVLDRFWPELQEYAKHVDKGKEPWQQEDLDKLKADETQNWKPQKQIIYYTDNQLNVKLAKRVQNQIKSVGLPIISASLKPMDNMGKNIRIKGERGISSYFRQIVAALEASTAEYVFFCEHDVLYHPSHFEFTPPTKDKFYYNINVWRVRQKDGLAVTWEANQVAELCCARELALEFYRDKLRQVEADSFDRSYEPGGRDVSKYEQWRSEYPNIDIRHEGNLTKSKWSPEDFRDKSTCVNWQESTIDKIPGWDKLKEIIDG